jgi:hypothetical protein
MESENPLWGVSFCYRPIQVGPVHRLLHDCLLLGGGCTPFLNSQTAAIFHRVSTPSV